jgi:hypothetical protein
VTEYKPENPLIVQGDHTILVEVDNPLYVEARDALARFAELVKSPGHIHTYRVAPLSIWTSSFAPGKSGRWWFPRLRISRWICPMPRWRSRFPACANTETTMSKKKRVPKFLQAMNARRQPQVTSTTESVIAPTETSLRDEVEYICKLASAGDGRVVGFSQLVFFSTSTRDAWMLDWEDELAICLMKDGDAQPFELGETERQFAIHWQGRYQIEGGLFAYIDNKTPTQARVIDGYPTEAIGRVIARLRRGI